MRIRSIAAALVAAAVLAPAALQAQTLPQRDRPIKVTVRMSTTYPLAPGDNEAAIQQQARALFYKTAAGECALITSALKGDCTLVQVTVVTRHRDQRVIGNQAPTPTVSAEGTMSFALAPTRSE